MKTIIIMLFLTVVSYAQTSYIALPLNSINGQNYRAAIDMKDGGDATYAQPIFTYSNKTSTKSAVTDNWKTYIFDFTGDTSSDTLKISSTIVCKFKLDNFTLKK